MTLVVEDGTGLSTANAYLTEAGADAYFLLYPNASWTGSDKEDALLMATQYLDMTYGGKWRGSVLNTTQSLDWPRSGAYDRNGTLIDSDAVPTRLEQATAEVAVRHLIEATAGTTLTPDITSPGDIKEEDVKVGPIRERIEYLGGKSQEKEYRKVELLLADLIVETGVVERG